MPKIIRLTEHQLNNIVKRVLKEQISPPHDNPPSGASTGGEYAQGGTSTASAGSYISPRGLQFRRTEDNPYDPYDPYDPQDPRDPNIYPKEGSYESKLGRSPMCCKKCKNGRFKHQCEDVQKGGMKKYDSTNCVYATISDCQLNKRSKYGNIKGKKSKK